MKRLKLFLVDDHDLFREGLKLLLSEWDLIEEIYEAENGQQFIESLRQHPVDLVLLDIEMPVMNGMEAAKLAREINPEMKIIALSMYSDENYYTSMIESGADGFLLKNSKFATVKRAIEEVAGGKNYFSQEIIQLLVRHLNKQERAKDNLVITDREMEILGLICRGLSNTEIAKALQISKRTVEKHRQNLLDKTQSRNTVALVLYAIKSGYFNVR
ncbi:response regulator transcription factor [uncultured Sunxiuqinia sp.]|uniref:response regulator transcription factor n=1 Tax=uncultured Sunxiuqinia sp. TaxID=1573825 RepID=UPI0030D8B8D8|tara:strand:+ start:30908 stop:31552 length:645 start_codon:yes stop_codon:yes gene_type:complete